MASELDRESAKKSISVRETSDPEMEEALNSASRFQLEIIKENNRHIEAKIRHDLGFFGRAFGGEKGAPTYVALVAMLAGLAAFGVSLYGGASSRYQRRRICRVLGKTERALHRICFRRASVHFRPGLKRLKIMLANSSSTHYVQ